MILVTGATGLVGGSVCHRLVAAGQPVRALVRETSAADRVQALRDSGVQTVTGDVRDPASLLAACDGVDVVVSTISSMPFAYVPGVNDIATTDTTGMRSLLDASLAAGVKRFVYTSFSGHIDGDFPLRHAKRQVEQWVMTSGMEYAILRPSYFMEVWLSPAVGFDVANGKATIYGTLDRPISWISLGDVAEFAVAAATAPRAWNGVLELGGPRPISPREVVRTFEAATGRTFETTMVPAEVLEEQQRAATDPMQQSFVGLMRCYAAGDPIEMGRTSELIGMPLTSLESFAESFAASGVPAAAR
jgi:NADH dehydrogenase